MREDVVTEIFDFYCTGKKMTRPHRYAKRGGQAKGEGRRANDK
jgi:hypothetical protein